MAAYVGLLAGAFAGIWVYAQVRGSTAERHWWGPPLAMVLAVGVGGLILLAFNR